MAQWPRHFDILSKKRILTNSPKARRILDRFLAYIARRVIVKSEKGKIEFSIVENIEQWELVKQLRKDVYSKTNGYMLKVLNDDGSDIYDSNSIVFAAWLNKKPIATLRYTVNNFELKELIGESSFHSVVSEDYFNKSLEISRLVVKDCKGIKNILPALLVYSGMNICLYTHFRTYYGYTKRSTFRRLSKFIHVTNEYQFTVEERNQNCYILIKGDFFTDFKNVIKSVFNNPKFVDYISNKVFKVEQA